MGLGIAAFLAIRPGARICSGRTGLLLDTLVLLPVLLAVVALGVLADIAVYVSYVQDVALASIASALGAKGPWSRSWFVVPAIAFGSAVGLGVGLRRAWASTARPLLGWASALGVILLLTIFGAAAGKPAVVFPATAMKPLLASEDECRRASAHAILVLADSTQAGLPAKFSASQYLATDQLDDELREATRQCRLGQVKRDDTRCVELASTFSQIMKCGPYWFDSTNTGGR